MDYLHRAKIFKTKKRLGQNFLVNPKTIEFITSDIQPEDTVVEIGAGAGFVTEQLVKKAKHVFAIELDEDAVKELKKIRCENLTIVHQDILKTDISEFAKSGKIRIVANIPYYITAPIIAHLLGEVDDLTNKNRISISDILIMVQKEVAQRIVANETSPAKQYGLLTILSQFWAECEIVREVGRRSFYPAPKVDSAIVKMVVRDVPRLELADYGHFKRTVKASFLHRRKNIKNCLLSGGFDKENVAKSLNNLNLDETVRGESLSIEKFGELSKELIKNAKG